jgi:hypothetical protein
MANPFGDGVALFSAAHPCNSTGSLPRPRLSESSLVTRRRPRVWMHKIGKRGIYLRGYSRAHSAKVWRDLPPERRDIQASLRRSMSFVPPKVIRGTSP